LWEVEIKPKPGIFIEIPERSVSMAVNAVQAKKRYGLRILNYMVTSNHIHLLVWDEGGRDVIPELVKLTAGRTGQSYTKRKNWKGTFWEDRYHAAAVQKGIQ
jgi:putative transposase